MSSSPFPRHDLERMTIMWLLILCSFLLRDIITHNISPECEQVEILHRLLAPQNGESNGKKWENEMDTLGVSGFLVHSRQKGLRFPSPVIRTIHPNLDTLPAGWTQNGASNGPVSSTAGPSQPYRTTNVGPQPKP